MLFLSQSGVMAAVEYDYKFLSGDAYKKNGKMIIDAFRLEYLILKDNR